MAPMMPGMACGSIRPADARPDPLFHFVAELASPARAIFALSRAAPKTGDRYSFAPSLPGSELPSEMPRSIAFCLTTFCVSDRATY